MESETCLHCFLNIVFSLIGPDSDSHSGLIDTNSASRQANDFDFQEVTSTSLSPDVRQETNAPSPSQTANQLLQLHSHPCEVGSRDGVLHSGPLIFQGE